jgi:hypothetical protein
MKSQKKRRCYTPLYFKPTPGKPTARGISRHGRKHKMKTRRKKAEVNQRTKGTLQKRQDRRGRRPGGGMQTSSGIDGGIAGDENDDDTAEDRPLPVLDGPCVFLFRILGRLLTTLGHRNAASAEPRYCRDPFFRIPPGAPAFRSDNMLSMRASSSLSLSTGGAPGRYASSTSSSMKQKLLAQKLCGSTAASSRVDAEVGVGGAANACCTLHCDPVAIMPSTRACMVRQLFGLLLK